MADQRKLLDRIGNDFYHLEQQLTTGLQAVLEVNGVSLENRRAVREYMGDVMRNVTELEAGVAGLAYPVQPDPISGFDPKEHGHQTLASLFQEIRQDEMAGKQADAHGHGYGAAQEAFQKILEGKTESPQPTKGMDHEIER